MDQLDPDDVAALRMFAGAHFTGGQVILPSGKTLSVEEMQALTSAYAPAAEKSDQPPADPPRRRRWFSRPAPSNQTDQPSKPAQPKKPTVKEQFGLVRRGYGAETHRCCCCGNVVPTFTCYDRYGQPVGQFCYSCSQPAHELCRPPTEQTSTTSRPASETDSSEVLLARTAATMLRRGGVPGMPRRLARTLADLLDYEADLHAAGQLDSIPAIAVARVLLGLADTPDN
jgi:hypothetical protein